MRLFYRIDGYAKWTEMEVDKTSIMAGDIIYCHRQDIKDCLLGESLLLGREMDARIPGDQTLEFLMPLSNILFFTKIPESSVADVRIGQHKKVHINFGEDWYES